MKLPPQGRQPLPLTPSPMAYESSVLIFFVLTHLSRLVDVVVVVVVVVEIVVVVVFVYFYVEAISSFPMDCS